MAGQRRNRWDGKPVRHRFRDALSEIDWRDFERLLADYYRDQGYEVQHTGTGKVSSTFDGGVDLRLWKEGRLTIVQCKRENAYQVTHNVVHELLGIKVNQGAVEAIVVTTGEFTEAARDAGAKGHVRLIDGVELRRMLGLRLTDLPARSSTQGSDYKSTWEPLVIAEEPQFRRRNRNQGHKGNEGTKLVAVVVGLVFMALLQTCTGRPRSSAAVGSKQPASSSASASPTIQPARQVTPPPDPNRYQRDRPSPGAAPAFTSPTPAVSRPISAAEQAQRDEEARRYLERIPEVTHYRYSPLDQKKEPTSTLSDSQDVPSR